jgi:hypothetical protein
MNDKDKLEIEDDTVVPGGGPAEGEEVKSDHMEPAAVHPDYQQTIPGAPAPASTVNEGTASAEPDSTTQESGSDDES